MKNKINKIINEEINKQIIKEYYDNKNIFEKINNAISFIENQVPTMEQEIKSSQSQGRRDVSLNEITYKNFVDSVGRLRMSFNKFSRM